VTQPLSPPGVLQPAPTQPPGVRQPLPSQRPGVRQGTGEWGIEAPPAQGLGDQNVSNCSCGAYFWGGAFVGGALAVVATLVLAPGGVSHTYASRPSPRPSPSRKGD
jgi:hypothetical protein